PETLQLLAWALGYSGSGPQAVSLLRRAHGQYPGDFWINWNLGWQLLQDPKQRTHALRFLTAAAALRPHSPVVLCQLGVVLADTGDLPGASAVLRRATALKPELPAAHCNLAAVLFLQDDLAGAIAAYRRALVLDADCFLAHLNLGRVLAKKGD